MEREGQAERAHAFAQDGGRPNQRAPLRERLLQGKGLYTSPPSKGRASVRPLASRECPVCGQSVKVENLQRHFANVHPGTDSSAAISREEQREVTRKARGPARIAGARRRILTIALVGVLLVVGFVGISYALRLAPSGGSNFDVPGYCGQEGAVTHYHVLLVIFANGQQQPLPDNRIAQLNPDPGAYIGFIRRPEFTNPSLYCPQGEIHALHTHDGSGIIHVEMPQLVSTPPTLGDFFRIWGQPLDGGHVWSFTGRVTATMETTENGDVVSSTNYPNPTSIPFYTPPGGPRSNPEAIPQSEIFDGAYGTGGSGGHFGGEIIRLTIT